ncbi:MAG: hypothetical protein IT464_11695 [Planctomycetes bacterium]|nr:hypothetical protein [Planctomycetota bacterium]
MSVHVLRCPNCGADLDVADGSAIIRCKFCGARCRMDWHGADPVLTKEAQEIADALAAIDFGELERDLNNLNAMLIEDAERRRTLEEATDLLGTDEQLDEMAAKIVASGKADEVLSGVENMVDHGGDPVTLLTQNLAHRLALRVRRIQAAQSPTLRSFGLRQQASLPAPPTTTDWSKKTPQLPKTLDELRRDIAQERASPTDNFARAKLEFVEAERDRLLSLRRKYRKSRVWAILGFLPVMLVWAAIGGVLIHFEWTSWLKWVGWFLVALSPVVAYRFCRDTWREGTEAARKFNERATLHGLPELRVKFKGGAD